MCLSAVLLAGCGGGSSDSTDDFKGEERVVAAVVEDLEEAGRKDQPRRICEELLSDSLLQRLRRAGTSCREAVDDALKDADSYAIDVEDVRIRGDEAVVRVTSGSGSDKTNDTLTLERRGRDWKISSLGS